MSKSTWVISKCIKLVSGWRGNGVREDGHRSGLSRLWFPAAGLQAQRPSFQGSVWKSGAVPVPHVGRPGRARRVWGRHRGPLERSGLGLDQSQGQRARPQPLLWWGRHANLLFVCLLLVQIWSGWDLVPERKLNLTEFNVAVSEWLELHRTVAQFDVEFVGGLNLCMQNISLHLVFNTCLHTVVVHVLTACWMLNAACCRVSVVHRWVRHSRSRRDADNSMYQLMDLHSLCLCACLHVSTLKRSEEGMDRSSLIVQSELDVLHNFTAQPIKLFTHSVNLTESEHKNTSQQPHL